MTRNHYCTGCGETFTKTHFLRWHRGTNRCGGRFLPIELREVYDRNRELREAKLRAERTPAPRYQIDTTVKWKRNLLRNTRRIQHLLGGKHV